ncbi:EscC/YscC/HrcC family type III secretion system outer membrane ring protein [Dyella mobilis]|nr:EscC/YscC/HrcC family type III secretion system outer membrane ring protein [Dyella mobilis]
MLKDILATQPFSVVVNGDVRGDVHGEFDESAQQVFQSLESAYGFIWYFDGSVLYISASSDSRSEVIPIAPMSPGQAMQTLSRLGLVDARFPIKVSGGSLLVSGPNRYVELVSKAIAAEREHAANARASVYSTSAPAGKMEIRVFPLKYAQAQDVTRTIGDEDYTVPGVATILNDLLSGTSPVLVPGAKKNQALPSVSADPLKGLRGVLDMRAEADADEEVPSYIVRQDGSKIRIEADVRTNAILIYDRPEAMAYYERAIEKLDQPQRLVQLDMSIIDISSSALRDLGVDLALTSSRLSGNTNGSLVDLGGASFQGVIGSSITHLTTRLNALEKRGKAKILSQPKIVTLDNIEALIGNQSTAYARVAGAYSTNLYPITAGLQVKVTPQVIASQAQQGDFRLPDDIRLFLNITDGYLDQTDRVDELPVSKQNFIATQAQVGDGQTLLIGGYRYESETQQLSGVPGLSRVPVLGALFRNTSKKHDRTERLFLITPRVIWDSGDLQAAKQTLAAVATALAPETPVVGEPQTGTDKDEKPLVEMLAPKTKAANSGKANNKAR